MMRAGGVTRRCTPPSVRRRTLPKDPLSLRTSRSRSARSRIRPSPWTPCMACRAAGVAMDIPEASASWRTARSCRTGSHPPRTDWGRGKRARTRGTRIAPPDSCRARSQTDRRPRLSRTPPGTRSDSARTARRTTVRGRSPWSCSAGRCRTRTEPGTGLVSGQEWRMALPPPARPPDSSRPRRPSRPRKSRPAHRPCRHRRMRLAHCRQDCCSWLPQAATRRPDGAPPRAS
jgi:hypothetical protein